MESRQPLWGLNPKGKEVVIPVLGVTGANSSGKTLFALTIAPGKFPDGRPRTKYYDLEKSGANYDYDESHVDVQQEVRKTSATATPLEIFRWWYADQAKIKNGQYDVIIIDPINMLEAPLTEFTLERYADFGYASQESFRATGPLMLAKANDLLTRLILDLASRCQTLVFTTHLGVKYIGNKPTQGQHAKGKAPLMQLPTLYLWLERNENAELPRCKRKLKDRVTYTTYDPETFKPDTHAYLPPAMDPCTPDQIRAYIGKPANFAKLKPREKVQEEVLSDADKLAIEQQIAEDHRIAEETHLERLNREIEIRENARKKELAETNSDASDNGHESLGERVHADTVGRILELTQELGVTHERFQQGIARHTGGSANPMDLTQRQADELLQKLDMALTQKAKSSAK